MPSLSPPPSPSAFKIGALGVIVCFLALAPWWHNHDYLRDFYDYGLFINVNARLAEGQRPFTDFTTPAQSATFLLNFLSEQIGGGTYLGLTCGAAALIVASLALLSLALARRWSPIVAVLIAGAIVCTSASQHTIIFYNPLGILSLALVTWSFAIAPLLRREDIGWHALAALGLFLGGLNKINYHLLACAMAVGWIALGAVQRRAGLRPIGFTLLFVLLFGAVLPIVTEVLWTGAGFRLWFYNVVQLPLQARGGRISVLLSPQTYLQTLHDYYGQLRIPQAGLVGLLLPFVAFIAAWRTSAIERPQRFFLVLAAIFAALASTALLLTNNEISYLALSATLVLGVSLWLGFQVPARGGWFVAGLLLPALLIGAAGWESAWLGQRSQFGHADDPRSSYLPGENIGADFGYVRGLRLPPGIVHSYARVAAWRANLSETDRTKIFYGPGSEWLEHIWPTPNVRGLALISSAFDGPRESALFEREVLSGDRFRYILVPEAWDHWSPSITHILSQRYFSERIGPGFTVYEKLREDVLSARPLEFFPGIGGNVASTALFSFMPTHELSDGRRFVGLDRGSGELELGAPSNRAMAEAVLKRLPGSTATDVPVHFEIFALQGAERYSRWKTDVVLPAGQSELVVSTGELDSMGMPLAFTVHVPDQLNGAVMAGWRSPQILYTADHSSRPPRLRSDSASTSLLAPEIAARFLPDELRGSDVYFRNATIENGQIHFWAGGEIWIHLNGLFHRIEINAQARDAAEQTWHSRLTVLQYIGGRLEYFHPLTDPAAASARFEAASTQADGWLGLLANSHPATTPFTVKIESASRR